MTEELRAAGPVLPGARVLLTGASGYLAGFVAARLATAGYRLRGFDLVPPPAGHPVARLAEPGGPIELVPGDITSPADVRRAVAGQDAVVHTVALVRGRHQQPLERFADVMVKGTWLVLEAAAAAGVRRVVNVSSVVAVGPPVVSDEPLAEGCAPAQRGSDFHYQLAKWLGEEAGRAYARARGLSVVSLRPGVIAGDGANLPPQPPSPPRRRWLLYVDPRDVAQAVEGALRASDLRQDSYHVMADHPEAVFDVGAARRDLGYAPEHNWSELRCCPEPGQPSDPSGVV